ncbi:mucin-19 [Drosophila ficusphila]|uniref:mucin-19 n=1 Tax=Drosophila ficusphila TaxID=30025 RepID=UPI0007E71FB9|nr:mucin-19 [Drosophila ficusphila]
MSLMKIHRGNESFCSCWLLLLVALLLAEAGAAATLSETQTNATNGAIREPPVQQQQQLQLNATAGDGESRNSAEIFSPGDVDAVGDKPTTYRPSGANRPSIAPLNSAQDRERRLMNVLAARRTALHRGGFRTRIGTTGRSAISPSAAVETTSKAPSDPRSVCIRNCTKNFTRRTTASCMRQCANFTRMAMPSNGNSSVVLKGPGSSKSSASAGDRDTNEILFSDESSHGLFVVAKDQNATVNHIADGTKPTVMGKGVPSKTNSMEEDAEEEEDELKPYVYFGAKLPPIRPGGLTIKAADGDDEHPRVLEVSVAQSTTATMTTTTTTTSTTPQPVSTTRPTASTRRPLTPVERSRSKYKYHMRERGLAAAAAPPAAAPPAPPVSRTRYVGSGRPTAGLADPLQEVKQSESEVAKPVVRRVVQKVAPSSSTPLIITVLSAEEETTVGQAEVQPAEETTTTTTTTTTEKPTTTSSTTSTTTTTAAPSTTRRTTTTAAPTTTSTSTTTTTTSTSSTTPSTTTTSSSSTTTAIPTTTKMNSIIEKDKELIRALGPALTQEINIEDANNLIIFCNNTSDCGVTPRTQTHQAHTTDSSPKILRTTVLTSIRSTVHPRPTSTSTSTTTTAPPVTPPGEVYIGIVESSSSVAPADISSTVIANERDVNLEMRRMNLVTLVLVAVGVIPLAAIILYLVRNYVVRRRAKQGEVFDVCITDQQPISPVKKVDSKYQLDDDEDEVDHPHHQHSQHHQHHQAMPMSQAAQRDANHNRYGNNDDKTSLASEFQEFERSNIRLKSLLGEGNFGQVWKAEADDLSGHFGATRIVAVKTIRACSAQVSLKDEANIMRKLGSHQNVVTLLGACVESEPHMLIMEYAMRGRLLSLLRAARSATNILPASVPGGRSLAPLSPRTLAGFALDIACGMEYIAGRRVVHRDLAARNVLLDHNGMCKICDFGMSIDLDAERLRKEQEKNAANDLLRHNAHKFKFDFGSRYILQHWQHTFGQGQGQGHCSKDHPHGEKKSHHGHDTIGKRHALPIRWMAPESLQYHMFTTETDIWAFGIVLWEIATLGSTPYSQLTGREVIRRVPQGLRPDLPKESRHEFYNLMSRCWHKEPHMRPSFAQSRLEITRSLHKWVDDDSAASDYMDVSGFSEDLEHGVVYFNHRISEFECEI